MRRPEELVKEINRVEKDIQDLLDYRTEVNEHRRSVRGWARFVVELKLLLVARQIERHLVFLKLELKIAQNELGELEGAEARSPSG
jgi:hypothetical protein